MLAFVLSLVVLGSSLFPGYDPEELYKVPELLAHYQQHKQSSDLGFLDFLAQHYLPGAKHEGKHDHSKLPMFEHNHFHAVFFIITLPTISWQLIEQPLLVVHHARGQLLAGSFHPFELLRPPKA